MVLRSPKKDLAWSCFAKLDCSRIEILSVHSESPILDSTMIIYFL